MSADYSVSLFTDWQTDTINQVWIKRRVPEDTDLVAVGAFFGAKLFHRNVHPILAHSPENFTEQMGVAGPWFERLPHFKMEFTPSSGKELQNEFFVPLRNVLGAFEAIHDLKEQLAPLLMISEIRNIAADDFWMSPCYGQDCVVFHFTWEQEWDKLQKLLPILENTLQAFDVRPHWGKVFTMSSSRLKSLYPKLTDFRALLKEYDRKGKFVNAYLEQHFFD